MNKLEKYDIIVITLAHYLNITKKGVKLINKFLANVRIEDLLEEDQYSIAFTFTSKDFDMQGILLFTTGYEQKREKLKQMLTKGSDILIDGCIENHERFLDSLVIRVKRFSFIQSLFEKLEINFMIFEEINESLEAEIAKYLSNEGSQSYEQKL